MSPRACLIALAVVACDRDARRTPHAPVDPSLDLALVVPEWMTRLQAGVVQVKRVRRFPDAAAWADDLSEHNQSHVVADPTPSGDGWVVDMRSRSGRYPDVRMWYRPLEDDLGITCMALVPLRAPTADEHELARKACAGTQRVRAGLYVPFAFSTTEPSTDVELAVAGEPLNWSVRLERVADSPDWRFRHEGVDGRQRLVDRGTVDGGDWFLSVGEGYTGRVHHDVVARRRIGALELACHGDTYTGEEYARRQLALCLGLERP